MSDSVITSRKTVPRFLPGGQIEFEDAPTCPNQPGRLSAWVRVANEMASG